MKTFFVNFNFARALILLCVLGSFPLAWYAWQQYELNSELKTALAKGGRVEMLVQDIQQNARRYTALQQDLDAEGLAGKDDAESYIRGVAWTDNINLGQVKVVPTEQPRGGGIVDMIYRITPADKEKKFSRTQLANFLFTLENESQRIRVTEVNIEAADGRKVKADDIPNDQWSFDARITSRQREE